ncbi:MAG: uracil-DNA glycosylase [Holosporales bacterium]|jgi:DNA polymerase|nr:uracil-DNA glycosylase [Holosporales bacterium]
MKTASENFSNGLFVEKKIVDWAILQNEFGEDCVLSKKNINLEKLKKIEILPKVSPKTELETPTNDRLPSKPISSSKVEGAYEAQNRSVQNVHEDSSIEATNKFAEEIEFQRKSNIKEQKTRTPSENQKISALKELKDAIFAFEKCDLKKYAINTVFADGNPDSQVMFIGEAPGFEEDKQGLPFVGQSGRLLNKMLATIGLLRQEVYITNVVYWRPPGNRTPEPYEIDQCRPFFAKHIELIAPKILVLLGMTAMKAVLQVNTGLSKARGFWHYYAITDKTRIKTMVTFHPSYLLRSPGQKAFAWEDFMMIKEGLTEN